MPVAALIACIISFIPLVSYPYFQHGFVSITGLLCIGWVLVCILLIFCTYISTLLMHCSGCDNVATSLFTIMTRVCDWLLH